MGYDEAIALAKERFPEAFAASKPAPKTGIMADIAGSASNLLNLGRTGLASLTGDSNLAVAEGLKRQQATQDKYKSGLDLEKITQPFEQGDYLASAGEAVRQVPSAVASLAPSVAQEMTLAKLGRVGGGALGALLGRSKGAADVGAEIGQYGTTYLVNAIQALGGQAQAKAQEQLQAGQKIDVDTAELLPYAGANAALNLIGTKIAMPSVFKKAIGQRVAAEADDAARAVLLAEAQKVAKRGTLETIGRGIGGFAFGELPTEVLQDVVDRAAIGKPLDDDEAIKDYRNTALTMLLAAPIGGGFGVQQRSGARGVVAQDETAQAQQRRTVGLQQEQMAAQQQQAQEEAAAQALEIEKQSPEYAKSVVTQYDTLQKQKQDLIAQKRKIVDASPTADADRAFNAELNQQLKAIAAEIKPLAGEYNRVQPIIQQELEKQRVAGMTPEDYMLEQMGQQDTGIQAAGRKTNKGQLFPTEELAPAPADTTLQDYAAGQITAAQGVGALTTNDYLDYLMQDPETARQLLLNRVQLPLLVKPQEDKEAQERNQKQAEKTIYSALGLQLKAYDKQQAEQEKQKTEQLERVRGQMAGAAPGADIMGAARQAPAVQAGEQQRAVDEARLRVVTPEVEGIQKLGQTPDYSPAQALRQSYETRKASEQQDEDLVNGLLDTLPKGGMITPGQVFQGLGGGTMRERSDLLTQLAVAREASGKSRQGGVKDNDVSRGIIEKLRALKETETTGKGQETAPMQTVLAGISVPEARAKEAAANKYADQQNQQLLTLTRMLGKVNQGTLVLPDTFKQRTDAAKQAYFEHHANEIDARRDAFGLPPMAAWERGEARARVMEALNELGDRWGGAANAGPAGQRQFGSQVQAVSALQEQMRANIQSTVANAAKRANLNATNEVAEKTGATPTQYYTEDAQGNKKPIEVKQEQPQRRIAAPAELTLREEKQPASIEDSIQTLLDTADNRQRAVPTAAIKPVKKVGSLADISQLLTQERSDGTLEPMSAGSISLLQKLQEVLPQTTDEDFRTLAGKIVRQIRTGNEPNLFDVRDLTEMSKGMEAAGQSETRPGTSTEELQRTSAQPQLDLFADDTTQTVRATPRNFQKMLDSKNVQQLRQTIAKQNQDTGDELASVENTLTDAQAKLAKAEKATKKALDKIAALEEGADIGSSPLVDQSSEALATVKLSDEKLKTRSRVAPETSRFVAEYGLEPTNKTDDEIKLAWAEATRDVVAAESALQALPLRIAYLTDIRDSVAGLSKKGKQDLVALIDEALRFSTDLKQPAAMRDSLEQKEFIELKQWLDPEKANKEIKRLKAVYNQAKKSLAPARERLDAALAKYEEGSVVREALEREQKKAQDALAKAQRAENAARAAVKEEQKQDTTDTEEVGTPNAEYRAALQRAREGLNLPGVRNLVDTTAMKQTIMGIRSAMGSYDAQLENKKLTEEKRAEIQAKRDDAARKLESVYLDAPRITSEIKEDGQLDLERAFDDAQTKAYDKQMSKRRKRAGESAPVLPSVKSGPVVKGVRSSAISQSGEKTSTAATEEAGTALEKLAEERAKLADLERREKFLRDNGKAKSGGRLTPTFKALQASIDKQKGVVAKAAEEQGKIVAEVRETQQALGKKKIQNVASETEVGLKGDEASIPKPPKVAFSRGVPVQGQSVTELRSELRKAVGDEDTYAKKVSVYKSVDEFLQEKPEYDGLIPSDAKAFVDPDTERAYMFADNIAKNEGLAILLHEVGVHIGFRNFFNAGQFKALANAVRSWSKAPANTLEGRIGRAAERRAREAGTTEEQMDDELIAYAVEEAVKAGVNPAGVKGGSAIVNWLRMIVKAFTKALEKFGLAPESIKVGDLVNMAYGAAQLELKGTWHGTAGTFTEFDHKYMSSGEGSQAFGYGTYRAERESIGQYYKRVAEQKNSGRSLAVVNAWYDLPEIKKWNAEGANKPVYKGMTFDKAIATWKKDKKANADVGAAIGVLENYYTEPYYRTEEEFHKAMASLLDTARDNARSAVQFSSTPELRKLHQTNLLALELVDAKDFDHRSDLPPTLLPELPKGRLLRTLHGQPEEAFINLDAPILDQSARVGESLRKVFESLPNQQKARFNRELSGDPNPSGKDVYDAFKIAMGDQKAVSELMASFGIAGNKFLDRLSRSKPVSDESRYNYVDFLDKDEGAAIIAADINPVGPASGLLFSRKPQYGQDDALSDLARRVVAQPKSFSQRMGSHFALETEMNLVDMRAGLREALKAGAKEMGDTKNFVQAMYSVTKSDQKMAVVSATLMNGPMELYTDAKGFHGIRSTNEHSAKEVFDAIGRIPGGNARGRVDLATTYMIAQRAANKGLAKLDVGGLGISEADLRSAMAAVNADPKLRNALETVRTSYNAYNKGLIQFLASTGAIPKETATKLLKDGDYVPFYRVNENGMADLVFSDEVTINIGDIRHQPYLAELKGGESKILPLTESLPRNTLLITDKALTNLATKNVAYAFQSIGAGKGRPDKEGKPTNAMPIHKGSAPAGSDIIKFNQEPDANDPKDDGQRWVRVRTDDTIMGGIPAELIVKSLEGAHLTLPAFLKIGGIAGDILRAGVTRMPIYIARQLVRDPMAASFTGGLNYNPLTAVAKAGQEFVKMSRGTSETGKKLIEKGLIQSGIFTGDPDDIAKMALQLAGNNQGAIDRLFAGMDKAAMNADAATRALVYDNAIKNGLSEVEADMATMESMNFYKRGLSPTVQYASRLIPFFNAQIQGLNVLYKAATGKMPFEEQQRIKQKFFNNAMLLVGTGILYAMAMEDDEYFKNAKPKDKYSNFFIPIPGVDEPFKLPIPYEAGWFFSLAVAAVDAMKAETDGKQQFDALRDMFLQSIPGYSSRGMPQLVKPAFEVFTNRNFFNGNEIETARMQSKTLQERFSTSTTEAAKAMSKALPLLSPVQIEHLSNGYFGQLPLIVMGAANSLFRSPTAGEAPDKRITEMPFIGSSFQKKFGGADADVMYRMATESLQAKASYESMIKQGRKEDAKDFLADNRTEVAVAGLANQYKTVMGRLRTDEERIRGMENMSAAEKRVRIDRLDAARQDISAKFENAIKRAEASGKT